MDYIISLSNQVYKLSGGWKHLKFWFYFGTEHTKSSQFHSNSGSFFSHLAIYNSISRLGNFVKITFDSSCLNSKHVLFGCSKQLLVCSLAISRKNPSIWRTNGVATNILIYYQYRTPNYSGNMYIFITDIMKKTEEASCCTCDIKIKFNFRTWFVRWHSSSLTLKVFHI